MRDLCILNSFGTDYLSQSLTDKPQEKFHPYSRDLPDDLKNEINQILLHFQGCMKSYSSFIQTVKKKPQLALILVKKYPDDLKIHIHKDKVRFLFYAAISGNLALVKYLIETYQLEVTDIKAVSNARETVLHFAARSGNLALVRYLIDTFHLDETDVTAVDINGKNILHFAAESGNKELVDFLIKTYRLDPRGGDNENETVLHYAFGSGNIDLVEHLIKTYTLDLHAVDNRGWTVLHYAVYSGNKELVQFLVNLQKFDLHSIDRNGWRVLLIYAAENGNVEEMKEYLTPFFPELEVF